MQRTFIVQLAFLAAVTLTSGSTLAAKTADPSGDVTAPADRVLAVTLSDGVIVEPGAHGRWLGRGKLPSETNSWAQGGHLVLLDGELDVRMPDGPKGKYA